MYIFYCLPKSYKNTATIIGRPIVSGVGNITEKASKLVDAWLRPPCGIPIILCKGHY